MGRTQNPKEKLYFEGTLLLFGMKMCHMQAFSFLYAYYSKNFMFVLRRKFYKGWNSPLNLKRIPRNHYSKTKKDLLPNCSFVIKIDRYYILKIFYIMAEK